MSVISKVYRAVQVGAETTPGTGVAASKLLNTFDLTMSPKGDSQIYTPVNSKLATTQVSPAARSTEAGFSGMPTYTQMVYPLSACIRAATITTPGGATNARQWLWDLNATSADAVKTFTVEQGDAARAQKFTFGFVNDFNLSLNKNETSMGGTWMGREIQDDITITGSPTSVAIVPVAPQEITIKLADTQAGLDAASVITQGFSVNFSISNRHAMQHRLDGTTTFASINETTPDISLNLVLDADDSGFGAILTKLTGGSQQFIRVNATSASEAESGINYEFNLDFCGAPVSYPSTGDQDGALTAEWSFAAIKDATWGKAFEITLVNLLTAL